MLTHSTPVGHWIHNDYDLNEKQALLQYRVNLSFGGNGIPENQVDILVVQLGTDKIHFYD